MARTKTPGRLEAIADSAVRVFTHQGYGKAQTAEIAKGAGVSNGTLFLYVENKEACLWLALNRAAGAPLPSSQDGPIRSKTLSDTFNEVEKGLDLGRLSPRLVAAAARKAPEGFIEQELRELLEERYDNMVARRTVVLLVMRVADDWPELAALFYVRGRRPLVEAWTSYLRNRSETGHLRPLKDAQTAARIVIETVAWSAMHRHNDRDSAMITDRAARETTIDLLVHTFLS